MKKHKKKIIAFLVALAGFLGYYFRAELSEMLGMGEETVEEVVEETTE